jgi:hypothetical protein
VVVVLLIYASTELYLSRCTESLPNERYDHSGTWRRHCHDMGRIMEISPGGEVRYSSDRRGKRVQPPCSV